MRVNVYAEEITDRVEIISKTIDGQVFTGLRLYLELPVTHGQMQVRGPFIHRPGDDDSSAVTFWGKHDLRVTLRKALEQLDEHYLGADPDRQWAIHIQGPDDIVPAPSRTEADAACVLLNADFARSKAATELGMRAVVVPWTGEPIDRAQMFREYRALLQTKP